MVDDSAESDGDEEEEEEDVERVRGTLLPCPVLASSLMLCANTG